MGQGSSKSSNRDNNTNNDKSYFDLDELEAGLKGSGSTSKALYKSYTTKRKEKIPFLDWEVYKIFNDIAQIANLGILGAHVSGNEYFGPLTSVEAYGAGVAASIASQTLGGLQQVYDAEERRMAIQAIREFAASLGKAPTYEYLRTYLTAHRVAQLLAAASLAGAGVLFQAGDPLYATGLMIATAYLQKASGHFALTHVERTQQEQQAVLLAIEQMKNALYGQAVDIVKGVQASANARPFYQVVNEYLNGTAGKPKIDSSFAQEILVGLYGENTARKGWKVALGEGDLESGAAQLYTFEDKAALKNLFDIAGYGENGVKGKDTNRSKLREGIEYYIDVYEQQDVIKVKLPLEFLSNDVARLVSLIGTSAHISTNESAVFEVLRSNGYFYFAVSVSILPDVIHGLLTINNSDALNSMITAQRELVSQMKGGSGLQQSQLPRDVQTGEDLKKMSSIALFVSVMSLVGGAIAFYSGNPFWGAAAFVGMGKAVNAAGKFREQSQVKDFCVTTVYEQVTEYLLPYLKNGNTLDELLNTADAHGHKKMEFVNKEFAQAILLAIFGSSAENYGYVSCVENSNDFKHQSLAKEKVVLKALFEKAGYEAFGKSNESVAVEQQVTGGLGSALSTLAYYAQYQKNQQQYGQQYQQYYQQQGQQSYQNQQSQQPVANFASAPPPDYWDSMNQQQSQSGGGNNVPNLNQVNPAAWVYRNIIEGKGKSSFSINNNSK